MTDFIIKYRWFIIAFCLLTGVGSLTLIPGTKVDPELKNYIPSTIKSRVETDRIESEFDVQDMTLVLFEDTCIIDADNLIQIKNIDRSISRINGVSNRISPFTVKSIHGEEGMMIADPLIKSIPSNATEKKRLGNDILRNRFARGIVISSDLTTASITATINASVPEKETLAKIDSAITAVPGKAKITKGGMPYLRQYLIKDVSRDAIVLVPVALLIMLAVLRINLGSWKGVVLPFSVVILSTAFSLALIPLAGWKMSIISVLLPVILIAVANNYGIYLVVRFQELREQHPDISKRDLIRILFKSLNMPIIFSALTTIAGVLGLLTHSVLPARQVGVLAAAGISLALLMSLFLIPALIYIDRTDLRFRLIPQGRTVLSYAFLGKLSAFIVRQPGKILLISAIIIIVLSSGMAFLRIDTNQENYFSGNHPVKHASNLINSKLGGSQTISIMVEGNIKDPVVLKAIDSLTCRLEQEKGIGNVSSISQVIREMSKAIFAFTEYGYDKIPGKKEAIAQMFELYNLSGNPDDFRQLMNLENTKANILIRLSDPENGAIKRIEALISDLTINFPAKVTVGGYAIIMADFAVSIFKGQVTSLIFAIMIVLILLAVIFKSLKGGLIGSIPLIASIIILFGFMGFAGIALDAATALLSSLMIGVGVDFTIQYIWCFNLQIKSGLSYPDAIASAMKIIGRSIIINGLSVMAGFSALAFSGFTSIRFFGYLVVISIGMCLIGALVIIPAILMKFRPGFIGFETSKINKRKNEKECNIIGVSSAAFTGDSATS